MTATEPRQPASVLSPLAEYHLKVGRPLPRGQSVPSTEIPEPYRALLVHERDMTRTLEQFHGRRIHLEVLNRALGGDGTYWREVVLRLDGTNAPVEFGAIVIYLDRFPEPWRSRILEERLPLGALLNASGLVYFSKPSAYLQFECDGFVRQIFGLQGTPTLFGRRNTLRDASGQPLAEIVEILPPASA